MSRVAKDKRDAAVAAARAAPSQEWDRIAKSAGLKSKRTLAKWVQVADEAERLDDDASDDGAPAGDGAAAPKSDSEQRRQEGDTELLLSGFRMAVGFASKAACVTAGMDPSHPALKGMHELTPDEVTMIEGVAPSLVPAMAQLLELVKKHAALVCGGLFIALTLPRFVLIRKVAKEVKELKAALAKAEAAKAAQTRTPPPEPAAPASTPPPAPSPKSNGLASVRLYPEGQTA